jgi:hypothetical protein
LGCCVGDCNGERTARLGRRAPQWPVLKQGLHAGNPPDTGKSAPVVKR